MQSEAYVNYSHDITMSLRLRSTPISQKSTPNLHAKVPQYAVNMLTYIETHETVFIILYSTNWMIIGLFGGIEYEPEPSKLPVMS